MWTLLILFIVFVLAAIGLCVLRVLLAKSTAIRQHRNEVNLFGGVVKLVLWEANEGLVFLKNKQISRLVYGPEDGGGTAYIYPILGDEVRVRVPLTLKLTQFEDNKVLTRESIQIFLKIAFWWRVHDLEKFYQIIDRRVDVVADDYRKDAIVDVLPADGSTPRESAAELWLLTMAESCIRKLVSQSRISSLISKSAVRYLDGQDRPVALPAANRERVEPIMAAPIRDGAARMVAEPGTPDVLANEILEMLKPKVADYGLEIDRVEIQELRLPERVQTAIHDIWEAAMLPTRSEHEARAQQIKLQAAAQVIGAPAVALSEVMKTMKANTFIGGMPRYMQALFAKIAETSEDSVQTAKGLAPPPEQNEGHKVLRGRALRCPECGEKVTLEEGSGRVECPKCHSLLRRLKRSDTEKKK
jgi:hypothetical protein